MELRRKQKHNRQPSVERKERCALCDEEIESEQNAAIYGVTGHAICRACARTAQQFILPAPSPPDVSKSIEISPRAIVEKLDEYVIGQAAAKRALAVTLWKHLRRTGQEGSDLPKTSLLLYGPSGCGKTFLVQTAARLFNLPFLDVDITTFTETGYKGRDTETIIEDAVKAAKGTSSNCNTVIFIDEVDKLSTMGSSERQVNQRATQNCLLKLIEGNSEATKNFLFLFGGAFAGINDIVAKRVADKKAPIGFSSIPLTRPKKYSDCQLSLMAMPQDFIDYGLTRELVGRIPLQAPVFSLTQAEMIQVLTESQGSILRQYQQYFKAGGINLSFKKDALTLISKLAAERGVGIRGLKGLIEELMEPLLFEPPVEKGLDLTITIQQVMQRREQNAGEHCNLGFYS